MYFDRDQVKRKILRLANDARPEKFGFAEEVGFAVRAGMDEVAETITQTLGPRGRKPESFTWFDFRREYLQKQAATLDTAWKLFTDWKSEFTPGERQELYEVLRKVRGELNADERTLNAQERRAEWRERQEGHIARWKSQVDDLRGEIGHIEEQIAKCEEMEENAKSDDFADTVRGWIDDHKDRIAYKRGKIRELREKIEDVQAKLDRDG